MTEPVVGDQTVFGTAVETTYGTPVVVDRFYEFDNETLGLVSTVRESNGLRPSPRHGRRGSRRKRVAVSATGDVVMDVTTNLMGRQFAQMLGGTPTITAGTGGNTAAYTHVYPLGSVAGKSQTLQKQLLDSAQNVIQTLTYRGSKIIKAEFSIKPEGILSLKITYDCQFEDNTVSAATTSYVSTRVFGYEEGSISVGGSVVANVVDFTLSINNPQNVNRRFLGNGLFKSEPSDSDFPLIDGTLTVEVLDQTFYNLFKGDTAAALSIPFAGGIVPGASSTVESLTIACPEIHLVGSSPKASGFGPISVPIPFRHAWDGTGNPDCTITYVTSDAAA